MQTTRFTANYKGYDIQARLGYGGKVTYTSSVLNDKDYPSVEKCEAAIDAFDLKQRKAFKNPDAWIEEYSWRASKDGEILHVTVTSVDGDEAWIRYENGKREKKNTRRLFESEASLRAYQVAKKTIEDAYRTALQDLEKTAKVWKPVQ